MQHRRKSRQIARARPGQSAARGAAFDGDAQRHQKRRVQLGAAQMNRQQSARLQRIGQNKERRGAPEAAFLGQHKGKG